LVLGQEETVGREAGESGRLDQPVEFLDGDDRVLMTRMVPGRACAAKVAAAAVRS